MTIKREREIPFRGGRINIQLSVTGHIFNQDTLHVVADDLVSQLMNQCYSHFSEKLIDCTRGKAKAQPDVELNGIVTVDGNSLDVTLRIISTAKCNPDTVKGLATKELLQPTFAYFGDLVCDYFIEGSMLGTKHLVGA